VKRGLITFERLDVVAEAQKYQFKNFFSTKKPRKLDKNSPNEKQHTQLRVVQIKETL